MFKTNQNGYCELADSFKVSGDALYYNSAGRPTLPIGTVVIQETKAPAGYQLNDEVFIRWVYPGSGADETVNTYNAPTVEETGMEMKLVKTTDPDQADKSGFTFEITGPSNFKKTVTTPASGELEMAIPAAGTYTVKELPREGWILPSNNPQTVTFTGTPGEVKTVTFSNHQLPELHLVKTTDWPGDDPSGFRFEVTGPDGYKQTVTTDASGTWTLRPPAFGTYTVKELTTGKAANYQPQPPQTVTFDADHKSATVTFSNRVKRVELELVKSAEDGKVEGIAFRITGPEGYSQIHTTDTQGKIKLTGLLPGTYTATELPAADGRYRATEPQTITIQPGETGRYSFDNKLVRGGVKLQKVDAETGEPVAQGDATLEGAVYEIVSLNDYPVTVEGTEYATGEAVYTLTTDATGYAETPADLLPFGKYDLREKSAPEGYLLTQPEDGQFAITVDGELAEKTLIEQPVKGRVRIIKHCDPGDTGVATPEEGAQFRIWLTAAGSYDAAAESERDILTADADGIAVSRDLPYGEYTLEQIAGWEGADFVAPFPVVISEDGKTYSYILNNKLFTGWVKVVKTDSRTGEVIPVEGVSFALYDPDGERVSFFGQDVFKTTEDGVCRIPALLVYGKGYYLVELTAPAGYVLSREPVYFDVVPEDAVEEQGMQVISVEFNNRPTETQISKVDVAGDELPGAHMRLVETDTGKTVAEWVSGTEPYVLYNLPTGGRYTLHEDLAPLGYVKASAIEFVIEEDGVTKVEMVDKIVTIRKVDVAGDELPGAEMSVIDKETGDVVDHWTSTEEPHAVVGLEEEKTYIIREDLAPLGYAKITDIEFTVSADGKNQHIDVVDKVVTISKKTVAGDELPGAEMSVIDKETGDVVDRWTSTEEPHAVVGLRELRTYIIREDLAPLGYAKITDIEFTVSADGKNQHIDVVDESETVSFSVIKIWDDADDTDELRPKTITVALLADGETVDTVELSEANGWKHTFTDLPKYEHGEEITYTVDEVDVPEGYRVEITGDAEIGFTVTNTHEPPPPGPQTGDEGSVGLWTGLSGLSALSLGGVVWMMAKRRREDEAE